MATINMQTMRYINLLTRVTQVRTSKCFIYNNTIIFAVPKPLVARALGSSGANIRNMQNVLGKKIKIVVEPAGIEDASRFIGDITNPIGFKSLDANGAELVINAGPRNKAALIGRDKKRLLELGQIVQDSFGMPVRIV